MQKRGLSGVVTVLIIILLVLVATGIIWITFKGIIDKKDEINIGKFTIDLEIKSAKIDEGILKVKVQRNPGKGNLKAINFIVSDTENQAILTKEVSDFQENEDRTFSFNIVNEANLLEKKIYLIEEVAISPTIELESGKTEDLDVIATHSVTIPNIAFNLGFEEVVDGKPKGFIDWRNSNITSVENPVYEKRYSVKVNASDVEDDPQFDLRQPLEFDVEANRYYVISAYFYIPKIQDELRADRQPYCDDWTTARLTAWKYNPNTQNIYGLALYDGGEISDWVTVKDKWVRNTGLFNSGDYSGPIAAIFQGICDICDNEILNPRLDIPACALDTPEGVTPVIDIDLNPAGAKIYVDNIAIVDFGQTQD